MKPTSSKTRRVSSQQHRRQMARFKYSLRAGVAKQVHKRNRLNNPMTSNRHCSLYLEKARKLGWLICMIGERAYG